MPYTHKHDDFEELYDDANGYYKDDGSYYMDDGGGMHAGHDFEHDKPPPESYHGDTHDADGSTNPEAEAELGAYTYDGNIFVDDDHAICELAELDHDSAQDHPTLYYPQLEHSGFANNAHANRELAEFDRGPELDRTDGSLGHIINFDTSDNPSQHRFPSPDTTYQCHDVYVYAFTADLTDWTPQHDHDVLAGDELADHELADFDRDCEPSCMHSLLAHDSDCDADAEPFWQPLFSPDTTPAHHGSPAPSTHQSDPPISDCFERERAAFKREGLDPMEAYYTAQYTLISDAVLDANVNSARQGPDDNGVLEVNGERTSSTSDAETYEGKHDNDEAWQAELEMWGHQQ